MNSQYKLMRELKSEESFSTQAANHLDLKDNDYETLISSAKQRISDLE